MSAGAWLIVILGVCVVPAGERALHPFRTCLLCAEDGALSGFLLNIVLYMPIGFGIRLRTGRMWPAILAGVALSGTIEALQLIIPGRFSSLEDLIANGAGAIVGAALAATLPLWALPRAPVARRLTAAWACVATLCVAAPGVLLRPTVPEGPLYAQWTPSLGGQAPYRGRVIQAQVADEPLPNGLLERSGEVADRLSGPFRLDLHFVTAEAPARPVPILRLIGDRERRWPETLQIGLAGDDMLVRFRYRADDARLDRPDFVIRDALAGRSAGDTVRLVLEADGTGRAAVTLDDGAAHRLALPATRGWSLLFFMRRLGSRALQAIDHLWLVLLLVPLGWWAPSRVIAALATFTPLATLATIPFWSGLVAAPVTAYLAGGLAAAGGWAAATRTSRDGRGRA